MVCKIGGLLWVINQNYEDTLLLGFDDVFDKKNGVKGVAAIC